MAEIAFPRKPIFQNLRLAEITFPRKLIFQNLHLPEFTFGRNYISPKTYFPEITFGRNYISLKTYFQNLRLAEITFPRKHIFSRNCTHQPEISLLIEFTLRKYIIMIVYFQKLSSFGLRVEQKGQRRAFSHVV